MTFDWKRPAVIGASFALTSAGVAIAVVGISYWYSSRPQRWDASTIKGVNTTVSQIFEVDEQKKDFTGSGFTLDFVLENTSGRDYTVPENLRLFERSSKTGALEELRAKLDHPFVVPAKEKTEVHASVEYGCGVGDIATGKTTERDGATCFKDAFGNVTEFVGFDDNTHTRLNLPKPIFYGGSPGPVKTSRGMAPDSGNPSERYAACAQARKLVPVCKQKGVALSDAKAADDGWITAGDLPTIPVPPNGYDLEADDTTCRVVYQWDAYCRERKMDRE